ncbi:MAG TPA: 4-phosphoerythronate dehydrogenase, partial [Pseudomonas sp.]|nr:4-phosphoerythronate dehydrogenase [Pseudomonas sp.]
GKLRGTAQIYQAFCRYRGCAPSIALDELMPAPWLSEVSLDASADPAWALATLCRTVYDPRRDDADFRRSLRGDAPSRRAAFDALRKHYPVRREISGLNVTVQGDAPALVQMVKALGASLR